MACRVDHTGWTQDAVPPFAALGRPYLVLDGLEEIGEADRLLENPASLGKLVKEEIDGGNLAVPDDYEIGSGVSWRLARAARYPPDPTAIAALLGPGERPILEVRMSSLDDAGDAVDLVTAAVSAVRFVEHRVFVEDLIDRCASTHGVDLTEHVVEIAKQQGRRG
jgi:hypothetical protein